MINVELIEYKKIRNCIRVTNGNVEIIAITAFGPRIIRYGFIDSKNEFYEDEEQFHSLDSEDWQIFGGHRLWHAPEIVDRMALPDILPVDFELSINGFTLNQITEPHSGIQKTMEVKMNEDGSVEIMHKITNKGMWPIEIANWALSVMGKGGLEVVKTPSRDTDHLPNRSIALWPYTSMNDPRVNWGDKYIFLEQSDRFALTEQEIKDEVEEKPFKFGLPNESGWIAHFNNDNLFVKRHVHVLSETYPDFNSSFETYTNSFILEIETLGPLVTLAPNEFDEHYEKWELFCGVSRPRNEEEMDLIAKRIEDDYENT
ncbi:MAG: hypothetical protein WCQ41_01705 [Bacillota bacterium]